MGLDSVELMMKVEDRFGVRLSDPECTRIGTVADLVALVISRLPGSPTNCLTARTFYDLRAMLVSQCGIERRSIRPATHIAKLFPNRLRREWRKLRMFNAQIPELAVDSLTDMVLCVIAAFLVLAAIAGALVSVAQFGTAFGLLVSLGALFTVVGAFALAQRQLSRLPYGIVTIGDLTRCIAPIRPQENEAGQPSTMQQQVLDEIREIIASQLGMPIEQVKADSHFVRDLNLD